MAARSSIFAGEMPWSEEPGGLQSTGSQKSWTWLKWLNNNNHTWSHLLFYLQLAWKIRDSSLLYEDHGWLTRTDMPSSHQWVEAKTLWWLGIVVLFSFKENLAPVFSPTPWTGKPRAPRIQVMLLNTVSAVSVHLMTQDCPAFPIKGENRTWYRSDICDIKRNLCMPIYVYK